MPCAFLFAFLFSKLDNSERGNAERAKFDAQFVRSQTGLGAAQASDH
jgi:cation/acetate symporter